MLFDTLFAVATVVAGVTAAPAKSKFEARQAPPGVPDYVLKYAPLVHLHSADPFFPTDLSVFLNNVVPKVNHNEVPGPKPLDLNNVNTLGADVFLTSKDDVTKAPEWIKGTKPDANGKTNGAITASIFIVDKGNGLVDAFYMFFYAYNQGGEVLRRKELNFGNHVGDFEHLMIRFRNGNPEHIWYSQHENGQAFAYRTVQKRGDRPIAYSSKGSHANYAIPGKHDHLIPNLNLPFGPLEDDTDAGPIYDPTLSAYWYTHNPATGEFKGLVEGTPTAWLGFKGRWGDQEYPESDPRQVKILSFAKYSSGPTGPADKQLGRTDVCPNNGKRCILRTILVPRRVGDEEDEDA